MASNKDLDYYIMKLLLQFCLDTFSRSRTAPVKAVVGMSVHLCVHELNSGFMIK
jgi:hypothetical protein